MPDISKLLERLRKRQFRWLFKRLIPRDNPVFFAGRQLIFGMADRRKLREIHRRAARLVSYDVVPATGPHRQRLLAAFPEHALRFSRRFEQGASCHIALAKGEVAGYVWIQPDAPEYATNSLLPFEPEPPGGYWYFDAFVKPQYRMKGVFPCLIGALAEQHAEPRPLYGETAYNNLPSIRAHLSLGYSQIRTVDFVCVLGLRLYLIRDHETGRLRFRSRFELNPAAHKI